jgi:hypothetical protein
MEVMIVPGLESCEQFALVERFVLECAVCAQPEIMHARPGQRTLLLAEAKAERLEMIEDRTRLLNVTRLRGEMA